MSEKVEREIRRSSRVEHRTSHEQRKHKTKRFGRLAEKLIRPIYLGRCPGESASWQKVYRDPGQVELVQDSRMQISKPPLPVNLPETGVKRWVVGLGGRGRGLVDHLVGNAPWTIAFDIQSDEWKRWSHIHAWRHLWPRCTRM